MSYLTRVYLNPRRRGTWHLLASPQRMHAAVESAFPPDAHREHRTLWRLDQTPQALTLYVTSADRPDFTHVVEEAGWPTTSPWQTASYDTFLDRLATQQQWQFRLTANPVHSVRTHPDQQRSKRLAHVSVTHQARWLAQRATGWGFTVLQPDGTTATPESPPAHTIIGKNPQSFARQDATVTLAQVTYSGYLTVIDPDQLRHHLVHGMGRGKAYGCGLMTLAAPTPAP